MLVLMLFIAKFELTIILIYVVGVYLLLVHRSLSLLLVITKGFISYLFQFSDKTIYMWLEPVSSLFNSFDVVSLLLAISIGFILYLFQFSNFILICIMTTIIISLFTNKI